MPSLGSLGSHRLRLARPTLGAMRGFNGGSGSAVGVDRWAHVAAAAGSGVFERRTTNNYWGIGPHGGVELERRLGDWGLGILSRLDGSILLGRVNQAFFETSTTRGHGGQFLTGQTLESNAIPVPQFEGLIGLVWRTPRCPAFRLFAGYDYEHWWNVGRIPNTGSQAQVYDQGVLLRADFNY